MKKLIISVKSTVAALDEVTARVKEIEKKKGKVSPHYEISFTNMKDFKRFIGNIDVLTTIQIFKPQSIYELAKLMGKDVSNLNRLINFFEQLEVIKTKERVVNGRTQKVPIVDYKKIEFDLAA